ncbi:MAG TPA: NAD(P)-dependent alcohol dehydrogenase [Xanthobacteraceae bacterium]|jgi:NADPH:quinone reductase-like Zn-dependent oxidoreductase
MRAYQLPQGTGVEALTKVELPQPRPDARQVSIRVVACSLNFRDLAIALGTYRMPTKPNVVPLSDGAGEVVEIGSGVSRVKVGDRVAGCFFQRWIGGPPSAGTHSSALGGGIDGMLREYAVLEEDGLVKLPAHLSFEEGATLPCAGVTAWHALVEHAGIVAGNTVLVQGTGGVSMFALQFARLMGAQVIVTSSSDEKLARARELGAAHGINYKTDPEWDKKVVELSDGGVDHVVEVGGPGTLARSLRAIRIGGRITLIGVLSGAAEINPMLIFSRRANVQGISVGSLQMFEAMNRAIATSGMRPVIDKLFSFEQAPAAYSYLQSARHFGKVVIRVAAAR